MFRAPRGKKRKTKLHYERQEVDGKKDIIAWSRKACLEEMDSGPRVTEWESSRGDSTCTVVPKLSLRRWDEWGRRRFCSSLNQIRGSEELSGYGAGPLALSKGQHRSGFLGYTASTPWDGGVSSFDLSETGLYLRPSRWCLFHGGAFCIRRTWCWCERKRSLDTSATEAYVGTF